MDNVNQNQMGNMPVGEGNDMSQGTGDSGQKIRMMYIVLAVVAVVALALWWWVSRQTAEVPQPTSEVPAELESINQELEGLDIGDINEEFEQIDQELDTL